MYFELFVDDAERAMAFYNALFGWFCRPAGDDLIEIFAGDDTEREPIGGFRKRTGILLGSARLQTHVNGAVLQWPVDSVERARTQAGLLGGVAAQEPTRLSNGDLCARLVDSEGNHFTVTEKAARH